MDRCMPVYIGLALSIRYRYVKEVLSVSELVAWKNGAFFEVNRQNNTHHSEARGQ